MKRLSFILWLLAIGVLILELIVYSGHGDMIGLSDPSGTGWLNLAGGGLLLVSALLGWHAERREPRADPFTHLTDRQYATAGGVNVLLITAVTPVTFGLTWYGSVPLPIALLLAAILVPAALLLAGFIRRHGGEIGEARFDTRNPEDRGDHPVKPVDSPA